MKYIITALIIVSAVALMLSAKHYQEYLQTNLRTHIEMTDSLQTLVDVCDGRVNDMRLQRDHAIEINNRHETRWNEMIRVRP